MNIMELNNLNKTTNAALRDLFVKQHNPLSNLKVNPLISNAFSISASITAAQRINAAYPKNYIDYSKMGSTLPLITEIQKQGKIYNEISKMGKSIFENTSSFNYLKMSDYGFNLKEILSPAFDIQKSFISLYSVKDTFANYNDLFSNPKFRDELTELQTSISSLTTDIFIEDFKDESIVEGYDLTGLLNDTSTIAENINNTKSVSYDDFLALKKSIETITNYIISNSKTNKFWIVIGRILVFMVFTLSGLIFDIIQQYQYYESNQNIVTKADLIELENHLNDSIKKINVVLSKFDYRIANHNCLLKVKRKMKSLTIYKIHKGEKVLVLEIRGKWMKISILDETDDLEMTGWVLKKYISKKNIIT